MNRYLEAYVLPTPLRWRVREYFHARRECQRRLETSKAVHALSASLQVEVIMEVQRQFIERVPFLKRVEGPCLAQVRRWPRAPLQLDLVSPRLAQISMAMRRCSRQRGRLAPEPLRHRARARAPPRHILDGQRRRRRADRGPADLLAHRPPRAMSYLEYRTLSHKALHTILEQFPETRMRLRTAVFVALARHVISTALGALASPASMRKTGTSGLPPRQRAERGQQGGDQAEGPRQSSRDGALEGIGRRAQTTMESGLAVEKLKEMQQTATSGTPRAARGGRVASRDHQAARGARRPAPRPAAVSSQRAKACSSSFAVAAAAADAVASTVPEEGRSHDKIGRLDY